MKIIFIIISILYGFKFNLNFYLGSHNLYAKAVYELYDESKITYEQLNGPVGIYAGSFDPPILGHKEIIIKAIKNYNLQILYVLVQVNGPKDYKASFQDRMKMLKRMFSEDLERLKFIPIQKENINEFAKKLAESNSNFPLYCFIGQDVLNDLPIEILNEGFYKWVVIPRNSEKGKFKFLKSIDILQNAEAGRSSSTEARDLILKGKIESAPLENNVREYIKRKKLYMTIPEPFIKKQKEFYQQAFQVFLDAVVKIYAPQYYSLEMVAPPFNIYQSPSAWMEKFANWFISNYEIGSGDANKIRQRIKILIIESIENINNSYEVVSENKTFQYDKCKYLYMTQFSFFPKTILNTSN